MALTDDVIVRYSMTTFNPDISRQNLTASVKTCLVVRFTSALF